MRGYLTFTLLVLCLVSIVLAWFSVQRLDDFKAYHQAIAEESTQDIAHEVARYVDEKKRLPGLYEDYRRQPGFVMDPHRGPRFYFELPLYREA
jgi:hypothetical protein